VFLKKIIERNSELIEAVVNLHQKGDIPANSYVIDVDTFTDNIQKIKAEADKYGLKFFPMMKQLGRNPVLMNVLKKNGVDSCVCVDMADARRAYANGMRIGHLGHLVQVPFAEIEAAVAMKPLYWTVYSLEKAKEISDAMPEGQIQNIMLRIYADGDTFYKGHEGGFDADHVIEAANEIDKMPGLHFAGLTTFPTQLYNRKIGIVEHTNNYKTLLTAAAEIKKAGWGKIELNAPGTTSLHIFKEMASNGITQVEPGHGMTGTTPIHAFKDMAEVPACVYVSEVSHLYKNHGYCFGGGMYIDPVFEPYDVKACVGSNPKEALNNLVCCDMPAYNAIDYYGILNTNAETKSKDTVVFGFRIQAFVTRAFVVPVSGIHYGSPKIEGIFDSDGKKEGWPI